MKTSKNETNQVEPVVTGISSNGIRAERLVQTTKEVLIKDDVYLDLADLERLLKVSRRTLFNWRAKGILPLTEVGGKLYIRKSRLDAIIDGEPKMQKGGRYE
ncbi:helix-turn-helix domain-containing protein [Alistipes finegoldii]|uniref:helix-turn-helix domain-containing protein n=1 Tax=Alistipes finegoldii TaxID=214856 RepID=UPI003A90DECE